QRQGGKPSKTVGCNVDGCILEVPPRSAASGRPLRSWSMCLAFRRCLFSLSSPTGGEGRGEEGHRQVRLGLPPPQPSPRSCLAGRGRSSANTLNTYSLERLRYVANAFQRAGSGGFPAARWWYFSRYAVRRWA